MAALARVWVEVEVMVLGGVSPGHQTMGSTLSSFIGVVGSFLRKVEMVWRLSVDEPACCCRFGVVTFSARCFPFLGMLATIL